MLSPKSSYNPSSYLRRPIGTLFRRLFGFNPKNDFGMLDELVGMIIVIGLIVWSFQPILSQEIETLQWKESGESDWTQGIRTGLAIIGKGASATLQLEQKQGQWKTTSSSVTKNLTGISIVNESRAFAVGEGGTMLSWDGQQWNTIASGTSANLGMVWMEHATSGWAVGDQGTILRYSGGAAWAKEQSPVQDNILAVSRSIAVTENGNILKRSGGVWSNVTADESVGATLYSVSMISETSGLIVGDEGVSFGTNDGGETWTQIETQTNNGLFAIHLANSNAGWAVGEGGIALRWNGSSWGSVSTGVPVTLLGVRTISAGEAWATGEGGTLLHYTSGRWNKIQTGTTATLTSIGVKGDVSIAVGNNGVILMEQNTLLQEGTYISRPKNAGEPVTWRGIDVDETTPEGTGLQFQIAMNDTGSGWEYLGPDGTPDTFFGQTLNFEQAQQGTLPRAQYIRLKFTFESIATESPVLRGFTVTYTKPKKEEPLEAPTLRQPVNNSTTENTLPTFSWTAVTNAQTYTIVLDGKEATTNNTTFTPTPALAIGNHQWKVRAEKGLKQSPWSETRTLTIREKEQPKEPKPQPQPEPQLRQEPQPQPQPQPTPSPEPASPQEPPPSQGGGGALPPTSTEPPPEQPILRKPESGSSTFAIRPVFEWNENPRTSNYQIQIDNDTDFSSPFADQGFIQTASLASPTSLPEGMWHWRVRAFGANGASSPWSSPFSLTRTNPPPLPITAAPALTEPIDVGTTAIELKGVALPDSLIRLVITSNPIERTTFSDLNGQWELSVEKKLFEPGIHFIQAQTINNDRVSPFAPLGGFTIPVPPPPSVVATVQETTRAVATATRKAAKRTLEVSAKAAEQTQKVVKQAEPEAKVALSVAAPVVAVVNPTVFPALPNIPTLLSHLFTWILSFFGVRKKRKPWGIVYDAISKEPVDLAIVRLFDTQTKKLLETQVTDRDGRFGFLVKAGEYSLEVTKPHYVSPSKIVRGKKEDGEYASIYTEGVVTLKREDEVINVSIPLDPENPTERNKKWSLTPYVKEFFQKLSTPLLIVGIFVAWLMTIFSYSPLNVGIFIVYLLVATIQVILKPRFVRPWGTVFETQRLEPVPLAVVSLVETKFNRLLKSRLSDYRGRFNFLPPPGEYKILVKKEGFEFPPKRPVSRTFRYRHPYFGDPVMVNKEKAIINTDIPVEKK